MENKLTLLCILYFLTMGFRVYGGLDCVPNNYYNVQSDYSISLY